MRTMGDRAMLVLWWLGLMSTIGWFTLFVCSFCGDCDWGRRVENPTARECEATARAGITHATESGHSTSTERGQVYNG